MYKPFTRFDHVLTRGVLVVVEHTKGVDCFRRRLIEKGQNLSRLSTDKCVVIAIRITVN